MLTSAPTNNEKQETMSGHITKCRIFLKATLLLLLIAGKLSGQAVVKYKNFDVAVYARAYEVKQMNDLSWLEPIWKEISPRFMSIRFTLRHTATL
jgi:hypothetical protein